MVCDRRTRRMQIVIRRVRHTQSSCHHPIHFCTNPRQACSKRPLEPVGLYLRDALVPICSVPLSSPEDDVWTNPCFSKPRTFSNFSVSAAALRDFDSFPLLAPFESPRRSLSCTALPFLSTHLLFPAVAGARYPAENISSKKSPYLT